MLVGVATLNVYGRGSGVELILGLSNEGFIQSLLTFFSQS